MTTITLTGVALRTHHDSYPLDINPFNHQRKMLDLFRNQDYFVAVNDSPTGGGKTSSWLAPVLDEKINTIAIYPTNALISDQRDAIQQTVSETAPHDVAVVTATADELADKADHFGPNSHGGVLDDWLRRERRRADQVILLTNPDIFVMMRRGLYRSGTRAYKDFQVAIVDEFHRAGMKEQNTLRFLLDEMQAEDDDIVALQKVAFLSATPDQRQERLFEEAMDAPYIRVTDDEGGERSSFVTAPGCDWYGVMPPVDLDVRRAPTFRTAEALIDDAEETLSFCRGGRTVVMLDGIHEVETVHTWLRNEMEGNIERIDGFYSENKRQKLRRFDVLVSNSAVEVGIDFDVDRIIFAGHNRDSFLQRLGRLRSDIKRRKARCYVPPRVADKLSEYDSNQLNRTNLDKVLNEVYPDPRRPETFDARYSAAESFKHLQDRLENAPPDETNQIKQDALARIKRHFGIGHQTNFSLRDMEAFTEALDWRVLTALQWYRGDNMQALVYDRNRERITTYDLFYLLRYGDVEFMQQETFRQIVPEDLQGNIDRHERYVDGFCIYNGTIELNDDGYGRDVYFTGGALNAWINDTTNTSRKPQMKSGLRVSADPNGTGSRIPSVSHVNQRLRERTGQDNKTNGGLLCYAVSGSPNQVKRQYELNDFFFLYPIRIQSNDMHSLAIGTDALYLHCHVIEQEQHLAQKNNDLIEDI